MSRYLCTFPGKFGDILWSLPTAKYIAEKVVSTPVDFAVMPYYESLLPLIQEQSYIDIAYVIPDWLRTHSNYGDQPWQIPVTVKNSPKLGMMVNGKTLIEPNEPYERIWNLGYRCHPGLVFGNPDIPLMDFIAYQQGITFSEPMIPFLSVSKPLERAEGFHFVAYAFNEQYVEQKSQFMEEFSRVNAEFEIVLSDLTKKSWLDSARVLEDKNCVALVGDRSANWVIANGLGKLCVTYEPHPSRHKSGQLGKVFGCPGGKEFALPFGMPAKAAGQTAAAVVKKKIEERTMATHG